MKNLYPYLFCGIFLICLNFDANSRKNSNSTFLFYKTERFSDNNSHKGVIVESSNANQQQNESETIERIVEVNEYVSSPSVSKTLEAITSFSYDEYNWNLERTRKYVNLISGETVNARDEKLASTYLQMPNNCMLQTNVNYSRTAFQESSP